MNGHWTARLFACIGWIALASSVGAATHAELAAKAEAGFAFAEKAGKKPVPVFGPAEPYLGTPADDQRGLIVYVPPIEEPFTTRRPATKEVRDSVELRMAPGQTTSFLLGVHPLKAQEGLAWRLEGPMPSGVEVEFLPVVIAFMARARSDTYAAVGLWLADGGEVDVAAGQSQAWLVRIRLAEDAKAGELALPKPTLASKGGQFERLGPRIRLNVLPFKLADPWERHYTFGVFCGGADFSEAQYREMKAHGLEAILWFWGHYGLDVRNEGGTLRMGFADLDATVERFQKAGLRGPIVLALGNDSCGHFERAVCQAFNLPMQPRSARDGKPVQTAVLDNPRIEELMVDALRQLFDHAKEKSWPEIVILPYDEPTERLMDEHRRMVRLFRQHFPKVRLYGVTMDRLKWAEMVSDTDILVSNGDWARIRQLATERKKSAWFYCGAAAAHGYAGCRWRYGLRPYAFAPDGMWFWCYNFYVGEPWNEFDGFTPDSSWVICWPPLAKGQHSVETLAYEGLREAVTDVRYAMTLEAALAKATGEKAEKVRAAYDQWRKGLPLRAAPRPAEVVSLREKLTDWLLELGQ